MLTARVSSVSALKPCHAPRRASVVVRAEADKTAVVKVGREKTGLWFASDQSLSYLDGTLPGDFGFDPLGLSDPEGAGGFITPKWLQYAEIINGRWAMLGAAGCLAPELLGKLGVIPTDTGIVWFQSGVIPPAGSYDNYWADPYAIFWINMCLMNFAELKRWQDYQKPGSQAQQWFLGLEGGLAGSGDPVYPGGPFFNFAGFGKTPEGLNDLKLKEVKNARLAMIAMLGFASQAVMTGKGPIQNLLDHISDPVNNNLLTNLAHVYGQ